MQVADFMNPPSSQLTSIGTTVKTLKHEDKIENAVQQLISKHPLISSVKDLKLPCGMLDFAPSPSTDPLAQQNDLKRKNSP